MTMSPPVATAEPTSRDESRTGVAESMGPSAPGAPGTQDPAQRTAAAASPSATSSAAASSASSAPSDTASAGTASVAHDPNADDTAKNSRDGGATLTPVDQGNSSAEVKITASIRKAIMADKSLSFTAKNVKIITNGTRVTLRGSVKTDAERRTIENAARATDGVTDVDNQLEVKM